MAARRGTWPRQLPSSTFAARARPAVFAPSVEGPAPPRGRHRCLDSDHFRFSKGRGGPLQSSARPDPDRGLTRRLSQLGHIVTESSDRRARRERLLSPRPAGTECSGIPAGILTVSNGRMSEVIARAVCSGLGSLERRDVRYPAPSARIDVLSSVSESARARQFGTVRRWAITGRELGSGLTARRIARGYGETTTLTRRLRPALEQGAVR